MNHATCRIPVFCLLPPYVLREIVRNGSPKQREVSAARPRERRHLPFAAPGHDPITYPMYGHERGAGPGGPKKAHGLRRRQHPGPAGQGSAPRGKVRPGAADLRLYTVKVEEAVRSHTVLVYEPIGDPASGHS